MTNLKPQLLALCCLAFIGCASTPPEKEGLASVATIRTVTLLQPVTRLLDKGRMQQGLLPGEYRSSVDNNVGTFFQGTGPVFFERTYPDGKLTLYGGGFWLPKDHAANVRFYMIQGTASSAESIDAAMKSITDPGTGRIAGAPDGGIVPNALGGAIGGAIVTGIIESGRGQLMLVGELPGDTLTEQLKVPLTKAGVR